MSNQDNKDVNDQLREIASKSHKAHNKRSFIEDLFSANGQKKTPKEVQREQTKAHRKSMRSYGILSRRARNAWREKQSKEMLRSQLPRIAASGRDFDSVVYKRGLRESEISQRC